MKNTPKRLKQKSLLGYFESSSPIQPEAGSSKKVSPQRSPTKRRIASQRRVTAADSDPPSDGNGGSSSSDVGGIGFEPQVIEVSSDEGSAEDSPRRPTATQRRTRKRRAESAERTPVVISSASEEENIGVPVTWKHKTNDTKGKRKRTVLDSDSEEAQPRKSKLIKGVRPPTPDDDDEDLLEEVDERKIIENRFRTRDKKSLFQQNLEKLRRKKRNEVVESSNSSENELEEEPALIPGAKLHRAGESDEDGEDEDEDEDEGLSGFIEEDSNAAIELPAEFSMGTYQDLMHHFKTICQLFVYLAVQPIEDRQAFMEQALKDQYFSVPLQIARRKITGMRDSLVTSSVWRTAFKKPLETYPHFETVRMDFAVPHCDACRLGGRMSTLTGRVSGEPYDKVTFETLLDETSSDDEEEEETKVRKEFNLGRFCARRTRVFHQFTHWEYALFKVLSQEVEDLQNRSTKNRVYVPVAYANGTKPPDDLSNPDNIMAWLDERGLITVEWQKIKEMMESARHLEIASKRGDVDD